MTPASDVARARGLYFVVLSKASFPKYRPGTVVIACDTGIGEFPWRLIGDERQFATHEFDAIGPRVTLPPECLSDRSAWTPTRTPPEKSALIQPTLVLEPAKFGMVPR